MSSRLTKRQTPLKWSQWTLTKSEIRNQRFQRTFRYRVVGYMNPDLEQIYVIDLKSTPIYEIQEFLQITYIRQGRRPVIESEYKRFFIHQTMKARSQRICMNCLNRSFNNTQCFSCNTNDTTLIIKYETLNLKEYGFQSEYFYTKTGPFPENRFPEPLKEELMMAACHPERKNLFKWIMDLEELQDMDLP